ncbi:hypothetical protein K440DRAFT_602677 [Wilcoxina mikolae CBS 423.85]|nr:hypothetical protein K440DRAFT_602677 [Wilcoxina mikolae CBS 423.85]
MPVSYIPSQLEAPATTALTLRASPSKLLLNDVKLVFSLARYIPYIFLPLRAQNKYDEVAPTRSNLQDIALHFTLFALTVSAVCLGVRIVFAATGSLFILYTAVCWVFLMLLCRPLNYGPRVLHSSIDLSHHPSHPREQWIFVNGICAGSRWLQENLDLISLIFHRPIIGVHNRSYGIIFDLLECLIQRDFSYMTSDIRIVYNTLKRYLLSPDTEKVVLLAHSQGGIIISAALDALYADLPPDAWDKIEIYTFGCAANHFSNPPRCVQCRGGSCTPVERHNKRQIGVIEHYANGQDFVARLGVLRLVTGEKEGGNQFVGKVFVRDGEGGHLFCQHYLGPMFEGVRPGFLDESVVVEEGTAVERARVVEREGGRGAVGGAVVESERAKGNTVREVSRLWMYKDGRVPE